MCHTSEAQQCNSMRTYLSHGTAYFTSAGPCQTTQLQQSAVPFGSHCGQDVPNSQGNYLNWMRLSCMGMAQNEVRLQLHALAYNLGVFLQGTDLPEEMAD